ncbi:MAG: cobalamin-binding protein [Deltaproteobacteria bacterium]|nr:MAG: cobalamin-binding protein [Deltaproteobacteria bacterium]
MRVVSLACSNTEIVVALGCGDWLVGVDDHSDYPEELVASLPKVGPDLQIDVDKVAALQPDVVLASLTVPGHETNLENLEQAGIPYLAPEPVSLQDVYRDIRAIAEVLDVPERAEALIASMQDTIPQAPPQDNNPKKPSLLVEWWPKPVIAPGQQSWVHDLIVLAGGQNPLGNESIKSRPMTDEEVADLNPDAIILSWCGVKTEKYRPDVIYRNPAWQDLDVVKKKRVFCVGEPFLGRPGPRLTGGYEALRAIVEKLS